MYQIHKISFDAGETFVTGSEELVLPRAKARLSWALIGGVIFWTFVSLFLLTHPLRNADSENIFWILIVAGISIAWIRLAWIAIAGYLVPLLRQRQALRRLDGIDELPWEEYQIKILDVRPIGLGTSNPTHSVQNRKRIYEPTTEFQAHLSSDDNFVLPLSAAATKWRFYTDKGYFKTSDDAHVAWVEAGEPSEALSRIITIDIEPDR